jgi:hypothetical protein
VLHAVACGNGVFVAVGDNATILNSADGRVWTAGPQPQTVERFQGVTFGGGEFVAVSGTEFWSSTDGLNWTLRANFWDPYQLALYGVTYGANGFVVAGLAGGGAGAAWSPDGHTWEHHDITTYPWGGLLCVCYGNGHYVAAGGIMPMADNLGNGTLVRSETGRRWTQVESGTEGFIRGIAYGRNTFVAVGTTAKPFFINFALTSPDGSTWTRRPIDFIAQGVTYVNGAFIAVGYPGIISASVDGAGFEQIHQEPGNSSLNAVTFGAGRFVVVGAGGTILTADAQGPQFTAVSPAGLTVQSLVVADVEVSSDLRDWTLLSRINSGSTTLSLGGQTNSPSRQFFRARLISE